MEYMEATIVAYREMITSSTSGSTKSPPSTPLLGWTTLGRVVALVRRTAIGLLLCMGPFNYPVCRQTMTNVVLFSM